MKRLTNTNIVLIVIAAIAVFVMLSVAIVVPIVERQVDDINRLDAENAKVQLEAFEFAKNEHKARILDIYLERGIDALDGPVYSAIVVENGSALANVFGIPGEWVYRHRENWIIYGPAEWTDTLRLKQKSVFAVFKDRDFVKAFLQDESNKAAREAHNDG